MKKVTLGALIIFFVTLGYFYLTGLILASNNSISQTSPIVAQTTNTLATSITTASTTSQASTTIFTLAQVATHATSSDCYLIINNNVYNVSDYLSRHPGGQSSIISRCGHEVSGIFASIHSNRAWDLLTNYKIGQIGN